MVNLRLFYCRISICFDFYVLAFWLCPCNVAECLWRKVPISEEIATTDRRFLRYRVAFRIEYLVCARVQTDL